MKSAVDAASRPAKSRLVSKLGWVVLVLLATGAASAASEGQRVDVGGYKIWMQVSGEGTPSVVFESGGGNDSSAWANIEPVVRQRSGVRTVVYDRAGLGKSDPKPGPYKIDDEVAALKRALDFCGVRGPIVLVAHSYGGLLATLMAANDSRIVGVVLVDAALPGYLDDAEVARILAKYTPQFGELERANPPMARVMIPLLQAYPQTAKRMREVQFPMALPVIDITAEQTTADSPEELALLRRVHAEFVAASTAREALFAAGSGHNVMRDRPSLVIDAIVKMVNRIRTEK